MSKKSPVFTVNLPPFAKSVTMWVPALARNKARIFETKMHLEFLKFLKNLIRNHALN